jgi:N6-adenosine-specific RNA methylase IME4
VIEKAAPEVVRAVERGELAVTAAAELAQKLPPKEQCAVLERAKGKTGAVRAYIRQHEREELGKKLNAEPVPAPKGPFRVIVADPPWPYETRNEDGSHRGVTPYPPMSIEAICMLGIEEIAHDDAVLWLWTTNQFLDEAFDVCRAWGFRQKSILTWVKDRVGLGNWLRNQTEHALLCVRGNPTITLTNQTTILQGPVREHSRKPDSFYELVESLCPGSKVELYAREPRKGWARWGAETEKFAGAAE